MARSHDSQQQSVPPKRKGNFYRDPDQAAPLPGKFYSQQTEKPSGGKGNFYTRQPSDFKGPPKGKFYRDLTDNDSPPNLDEEGQGPTGRMPNKGVDRILEAKVKKRSAKVKRQRGRL